MLQYINLFYSQFNNTFSNTIGKNINKSSTIRKWPSPNLMLLSLHYTDMTEENHENFQSDI